MPTPIRILGVIPARLASTRLPRKILREIAGKPLLAWVVEAARGCPELDGIVVAADSEEVAAACRQIDVACEITSPSLPSGTDRIHAISRQYPAEIYVNIQGDEPFVRSEHIRALLKPFAMPHVEVTTVKVRCTPENVDNPNAVKVVTAADGRALYFSRASIPYDRDAALTGEPRTAQYWKHIGLYAYRKAALERFPALPVSPLERSERLEQLRFLENGIHLYVEPAEFDTLGIDTEADLKLAEKRLLRRG